MNSDSRLMTGAFWLFLATLIFAPLAFGSVDLWATVAVDVSVAVTGILLVLNARIHGHTFFRVPGLLPLVLLLGWFLLQLVPLPHFLVAFLSPGTYQAYQPVLAAMDSSRWIPLSVQPRATLFELVRLSSLVLFYICSIQLMAAAHRLQKTVRIICILAVILAFLAIVQKYTSGGMIFWLRHVPENALNNYMGPWVYKNQYAGFMAMVLPVLFALFFYYRVRVDDDLSLRARIAAIFSSGYTSTRTYIGFGIIVIFLSIVMSLSRSGVGVSLLSLVLYLLVIKSTRTGKNWLLLFCLGLVAFLYLMVFDLSDVAAHFGTVLTAEGGLNFSRAIIWKDTVHMIPHFWLTGSGAGTFVDLYPLFSSLSEPLLADHAHNDYLELLSTGGVVAVVFVFWFVVSLLMSAWRMLKRRRDRYAIFVGGAAMAGIFSMLFFSVTDFNMRNHADALYFFLLCGLLVSCAHTRFRFAAEATLLPKAQAAAEKRTALFAVLVMLFVCIWPFRAIPGAWLYSGASAIYVSKTLTAEKLQQYEKILRRCLLFDSMNGIYWAALGEAGKVQGNKEEAFRYTCKAAFRMPLRGEYLQQVAFLLPASEDVLAERLLEEGAARTFQKRRLTLVHLEWLLWKGDKERALSVLHDGLLRDGRLFRDILFLFGGRFSTREIADALPPAVDRWGEYGEYLERLGRSEESLEFYLQAVDLSDQQEEKSVRWYRSLYYYYQKQKREEDAVSILLRGVRAVPGYARFHAWLGDYYAKEGIFFKAREEYQEALIHDPDNTEFKTKLEKIQQ